MATPNPAPTPTLAVPRTAAPAVPGRALLPARSQEALRDLQAALLREPAPRRRGPGALVGRLLARWRGLRRLLHYVAGSVLWIPPLNLALTPLTLESLGTQVALAAAFGAVVAVARPRGVTVGLLLAATALTTLSFAGLVRSLEEMLPVVLALLCYFGLGYALGVVERVVQLGD